MAEEFDPLDKAANMMERPTDLARLGAKAIPMPKAAGYAVDAVTNAVDVDEEGTNTVSVARDMANRLEMSVEDLRAKSTLITTVMDYHEDGSAFRDMAVDVVTDVAVGVVAGPIGAGAKVAYDFATAEEKPDPAKDLKFVVDFAQGTKAVTRADIVKVMKIKASPEDRKALSKFNANGEGANKILQDMAGDLLAPGQGVDQCLADDYPPFNPEDGDNVAQYIADRINSGNLRREVLLLDHPVNMLPKKVMASPEFEGGEIAADEATTQPAQQVASYTVPSQMESVGSDTDLTPPRTPKMPRGKTPDNSKNLAV